MPWIKGCAQPTLGSKEAKKESLSRLTRTGHIPNASWDSVKQPNFSGGSS